MVRSDTVQWHLERLISERRGCGRVIPISIVIGCGIAIGLCDVIERSLVGLLGTNRVDLLKMRTMFWVVHAA